MVFQIKVDDWMKECFGNEISNDTVERNYRFLEEALELVQSCGATQTECLQLVHYVYGRPMGTVAQEVGGALVTLAALCTAQRIKMDAAGQSELDRIWFKIEAIRAKQARKSDFSPLP